MIVKTRVLVIDDSAFNRKVISDMLERSPHIEVVGTAANGSQGLKSAMRLKPDVITLDLEMPIMDGFTFLGLLMERIPIPVIIISCRDDDASVFRALELGAVDYLSKPTRRISKKLMNIEDSLISKVRIAPQLKLDNIKKRKNSVCETDFMAIIESGERKIKNVESKDYEVIAIGSSTGGPQALQSLFTGLPIDLPIPIVVCQHMPSDFTRAFAERLNKILPFEVKEAEKGDYVKKGRILIAPGGVHMSFKKIDNDVRVVIENKKDGDLYAPSVDKMFASIAQIYEEAAIGIILTGMGSDGKEGVKKVKSVNGYVIAESEETSIIFGMPREAIRTGVVDKVLPLNEIAQEVSTLCNNW